MSSEKTRRLSPWRVLLALFIVVAVGVGGYFGVKRWQAEQPVGTAGAPWFASYTDVNATPAYGFEQLGSTNQKDVVLSFIIAPDSSSSKKDPCTPMWGGSYTLDQASDNLDLDRRIARLKQQGGHIMVSFGGQKGSELATTCTDVTKLKQTYASVIDRYQLDTIDLDVELSNLSNTDGGMRRAQAIAQLQSERRAQGKKLAVWATLPVSPNGLTEQGAAAVSQLLSQKVDLAGINAMTMDYGSSRNGMSMIDASKAALSQTQRQLGVLYQRAGTYLNDATLWAKIGATPMIGQNDVEDEIFTVDDAKALNQFAKSKGMVRLSMWSANRDVACGSNYTSTSVVSSSCSGVKDAAHSFAKALGAGYTGSFAGSASKVTTADAKAQQAADDPATSPYQIWSESSAYLQGTKVVWHHNVYEAKWWTQGDTPDNPVLQQWETPWKLIGPVLPGEKPIQQATLPAGTYPDWNGTSQYNTGNRVLFNGVPYQAKWWNQGQSPAAASSNPDASPWVPLTQAQINELKGQQ
jgi:chitinase